MLEHCLQNNCQFGIVYYNGSNFRSTGCTAEISQVIQKYEDGRADILIEGKKRFTLSTLTDDQPFLMADVCFFNDCRGPNYNEANSRLIQEVLVLLDKISAMGRQNLDTKQLQTFDSETLSFLLANTELLSLEQRQEALESSSTANRIQTIITAAQRHIQRSFSQRQLEKILGKNSDIRHIFN